MTPLSRRTTGKVQQPFLETNHYDSFMIDIMALRALSSVSSSGTLARAGDELGFTASAISQQIKRLERQVGVELLAPSGRGVVLTHAGSALVEAAAGVFQSLEVATNAARTAAGGTPQGTLHIVSFSTGIRGLLAPLMRELRRCHPELELRIAEADPVEALLAVDVGAADIALVHDADGIPSPTPASMTQRVVHTDCGDVVMDRSHPLSSSDAPLTSADLLDHAWVTSPPGTVCHQWFRRLFADTPAEPDVRHLADDFATQMSLVGSGEVIALIPRLARPPIPPGLITRSLATPPAREVRAAWRMSADANPGIKALLEAVTQ